VRGLTTAAIMWLTAAVGMARGVELPLLAVFVTAAHFLVVYAYRPLAGRILSGGDYVGLGRPIAGVLHDEAARRGGGVTPEWRR
jgi:MgtC family